MDEEVSHVRLGCRGVGDGGAAAINLPPPSSASSSRDDAGADGTHLQVHPARVATAFQAAGRLSLAAVADGAATPAQTLARRCTVSSRRQGARPGRQDDDSDASRDAAPVLIIGSSVRIMRLWPKANASVQLQQRERLVWELRYPYPKSTRYLLHRTKVAEAGPEGDVDFELLSPFGLGPDHRTPGDQASGASSPQSVSALLQSEFPNDPDEVRNCVYRGRCPLTQAWMEEAHRFEPYLTACLWLGEEVVAAAALRLNLPPPPSSASSSRSGADEAESSHLQRRGLGRLLTRCIMQTAAEQGHQYVTALVANRTSSAAGFWAGVGFTCSPPTRRGARLPLVLHKALEDSRTHSLFSDVGVWRDCEYRQWMYDGSTSAWICHLLFKYMLRCNLIPPARCSCNKAGGCEMSRAVARAAFPTEEEAVTRAWRNRMASIAGSRARGRQEEATAAAVECSSSSRDVKLYYRAAASAGGWGGGEIRPYAGARLTCYSLQRYYLGRLWPLRQVLGVSTEAPLRLTVLAPCGRVVLEAAPLPAPAVGADAAAASPAVLLPLTDGAIKCRGCIITVRSHMVERLLGPEMARGAGITTVPLHDAETREPIPVRARLEVRSHSRNSPSLRWYVYGLGKWLRAHDAKGGDSLAFTAELGGEGEGGGEGGSTRRVRQLPQPQQKRARMDARSPLQSQPQRHHHQQPQQPQAQQVAASRGSPAAEPPHVALERHYPRVSKLMMVIAEQEQQQESQKQPEQELRGRRREVLPLQVEFERHSVQPGTVGRLPAAAAAGTSAAGCEGSEGGGTAAGAAAYVATFQLRSKEEDATISAIGKVAADKDTARQLGAAACLQQLLATGQQMQMQMESQVFQAAFTGGGMGTALQAPGMSAPMMQPTFLAAAGMGPPYAGSGQPWLGQGQAWQVAMRGAALSAAGSTTAVLLPRPARPHSASVSRPFALSLDRLECRDSSSCWSLLVASQQLGIAAQQHRRVQRLREQRATDKRNQLRNRSASERRQLVCAVAATGSLEAVDAALEATQLTPGAWLVWAAARAEGLRPGVALALCKRLCARGCPVEGDPGYVYKWYPTLQHAAKAGNADVCEWLLARGRCRWLAEAVYNAAAAGHVGLVRVLLARCPGECKRMLRVGRLLASAAGGYPLPALEELYNHWLGTRRAQLRGRGQRQAASRGPVNFGPAFDEEGPDGFHCSVSSSDFERVLAAAAGSPMACWLGKLDALLQWHCGDAGPGLLARSPSVLDHVFGAAMEQPDGLSRGCTSKAYDQLVKAAAERGHVDIVRWLIEQPAPLVVDMIMAEVPGADRERVEMSVRRSAARMALDTGVCGGRPEVVRCVLQLGMEGVAPGSRGHRRSGSNSWTQAALSGSAATLQAMAEAGYAVYHCDLYETAAPHLAVLRMLCRLRCRGPGAHLALAALLEDPAVPLSELSNSASNRGFRNVSLGLPGWESERREALLSDDDFSIVDAMSASSSSALDNVTRVLDRATARGRLAEAVEPNPLFVNLAVDFCLAKLMETDGEAAVAADPSGGTGSGTSPLAAAAGLRQLVLHGRLGLLVGRSSLAEVLVQVVERLQDPELLAAALDVLQCLLSTEAEAPLALAAVGFLKGPLAALSQLPPEQRAQLAADVTALLRAQDAAAVAAAVASSTGGAATSAAACSAALGAGCLPVMCAVLRASSSLAKPQEQAAAGDVGGAVVGGMQLTPVQDLVLWCLINIANISGSVTTSCSAQPAQQGSPQAQMLSAGGTALLLPLLRAPAAAKRVLQLLICLAAADGPEAQRQMTAALAEACARCPEMQRQLVGAAGSCVTELQQQRPRPVASSQQLQLLLESVAAVVQGQRSVATGLLLPDWGGLPLVRAALRCLGVGGGGGASRATVPDSSSRSSSCSGPSTTPLVTAALRLLRQLLLRCGPPPHSSLPTTYGELVRALVRLNGLDDVDNSLRLGCLHACLVHGSGSSPSGRLPLRREAALSLHAALGDCHARQVELLQLTACVLDAAWLVAAAEGGSSSAGGAAADANVGAAAAGGQAPRPAAVRTPAAFVMRLAVAAVPFAARKVRDLLADTDSAEPPAASEPPQLEILLRALHAAVAALLATPGGAAVMRETDGCVAGDLVGDLVPLLLGVRARAATAAPVPAGSSSSSSSTIASLALQILVMLSTTSDSGDVAFLAEAIMCSQATSSVSARMTTGTEGWLLAAAARLLRPLASQLPRAQLAMLVRALTLRVAGGSGMYGSLAAECRLPVLLCLAACVENPLLRAEDWPQLACRGYGALCDHLVEAIQQDSGPAAGDTPQQQIQQRMEQQRADRLLLLRLACRWCLRAASRPILKQQLQQLACSSLQAALQSAAASQPPAAPACPSAAFVAALYCLAECQLAVCEGPLTALYSAPPSPLKECDTLRNRLQGRVDQLQGQLKDRDRRHGGDLALLDLLQPLRPRTQAARLLAMHQKQDLQSSFSTLRHHVREGYSHKRR
eukprot:XP_001697742.1 predicted protein [Chlamydomonas reinhardtii]